MQTILTPEPPIYLLMFSALKIKLSTYSYAKERSWKMFLLHLFYKERIQQAEIDLYLFSLKTDNLEGEKECYLMKSTWLGLNQEMQRDQLGEPTATK